MHSQGASPPSLGNLTSLRTMSFSYNQLTGSLPTSFPQLKSLYFCGLFNNLLSGTLPPHIGDLSSLYSFQILVNNLHGEIPASLARLTGLWKFLVDYNLLSADTIPSFFGTMSALSSLGYFFLDAFISIHYTPPHINCAPQKILASPGII